MRASTPIQELPFQKGLKAYLARTGRTQTSLARSIFVGQSSLNNWCRGKADPSVTVALLALEGMTLQELFGEEVANTLLANSMPKEDRAVNNAMYKKMMDIAREETRSEVKKKGFISKLTSLFSATR